MKNLARTSRKFLSVGLRLLCCLLAYNAGAAVQYWDPNGTVSIGGNGTWDTTSLQWSATSTQNATLSAWTSGNAADFCAGPTGSTAQGTFTVAVNSAITMGGIFNGALNPGPCDVTINGTGSFIIGSGVTAAFSNNGGTAATRIGIPITGAGIVNPQSTSGQLFLNAANTYSGGTLLSVASLVNFNNNSAFGSGAITLTGSGGALIATASSITIGNAITPTASSALNLSATGTSFTTTFSGNIATGGFTPTFGVGGGTGNTVILSGIISGTGAIGRQVSTTHGTLKITGANTYTGKTTLNSSVTSVNSVNSVTTPAQQTTSNLGKPGSAATGTLSFGSTTTGATLLYTGTGETTDRVIDLAGSTGGATIQNDGTGALTFTSATTATGLGAKTLTLQGSYAGSVNVFSGAIVNSGVGSTALAKFNAGTWLLSSSANTFSGNALVNTGTLQLGNATALGFGGVAFTSSGKITTVAAGGTLDLNGVNGIDSALVLNGTGVGGNGALINGNTGAAALLTGQQVASVTVTAGGANITAPATITVSGGGGGSGAAVTPSLGVTAATFTLAPNTTTYTVAPTITISGGGGVGATATCALAGTAPSVLSSTVTITVAGAGFTSTPTVAFSGGTVGTAGVNPTITANGTHFTLVGAQLTAGGSGYSSAPTLAFSPGSGTAAAQLCSVSVATASSIGGPGDITINSVVSGSVLLTKVGAGTLTFGGANTYNGSTAINAGTLKLSATGSIGSSPTVTVAAGAVFDVSQVSGFTLANAQTLSGSGTVNGSAAVANSATSVLYPNIAGGGTLTFSGNLTFNGASAKAKFDLSSNAGSGNDKVTLTSDSAVLTGGGANVTINSAGTLALANYVLFDCTGAGPTITAFASTPQWTGTVPANAAAYSIATIGNQVLLVYNPANAAAKYRSVASGNWNDPATWESSTDGGATWSAAAATPTYTDDTVQIRSPHVVTISANGLIVDQVTVDAGAQVTVASTITHTLAHRAGDTDLIVNGSWLNSGGTWTQGVGANPVWSVGAGGSYVHNTASAAAAPLGNATFDPASTMIYRGSSSLVPAVSISGRTYGNLGFESTSGTLTLAVASGASALTINGNLSFGATGAGTVSWTATGFTGPIPIAGDFTVGTGSTLTIGANTVTLNGNLVNNGTLSLNPTAGSFVFNGTSTISGTAPTFGQGFTVNASKTVNLGISVAVPSAKTAVINGTLNCSTLAVTGAGAFTLSSGATLGLGSPAGLSSTAAIGNIQVTGTRTFNAGANYTYNATAAQVTGNALPATVNNLVIATTGGTLSLSGNVTATGSATVQNGASLNLNGQTLGGALNVQNGGMLVGTGTASGLATVSSGGTDSPGLSIGTLTFGVTPSLGGATVVELNTTNAQNSDRIVVTGNPIVFGGTLTVTNIGDPLVGGEIFTLFTATGYSGLFSATNLPTLTSGLNWWTGNLAVNGSLTVNRPPTATAKIYNRGAGTSLKILKADLMVGASDPDSGDSASYDALAGLGSQGATVSEDGTYVYYSPANDNADTLQYRVKDTRGAATTKNIQINVVETTGQSVSIMVSNGVATVGFAGIPGRSYQVQRSTNLVDWATLVTTNAPANGIFEWVDDFNDLGVPPSDPPSSAYYRLRLP
jgi:autotransporter-associated beta strand protein